jgi:hypothetical protein
MAAVSIQTLRPRYGSHLAEEAHFGADWPSTGCIEVQAVGAGPGRVSFQKRDFYEGAQHVR